MLNVIGQGKVVPVLHEVPKWWSGATGLHILNLSDRWTEVYPGWMRP
jgi:hypothetical protein